MAKITMSADNIKLFIAYVLINITTDLINIVKIYRPFHTQHFSLQSITLDLKTNINYILVFNFFENQITILKTINFKVFRHFTYI